MLSQSTVVWVGAGASAVVVAGAAAGALIWIYPELLRPGSAATQVEASASEPKPSIALQPAAPAASVPTPGEATTQPPKPAFDVVSVEPTGEAVIAGRAAPNAKVELRDAGRTVAQATADASGQFVIIPPAFAPGDHSLSLAEDAGQGGAGNLQCGRRLGPRAGAHGRSVAAAAPAKAPEPAPSAPPLAMRTLATGPSAGASGVAIQSVAADAAGGLIAKGSAQPNATVRLYLNGADVGDAKTQTDGRWSLTIKHGMTPGGYVMRADEIKPGDASVAASADTPFEYPAAPGASGAPATPASAPAMAVATAGQSPAPPSADLVVELGPNRASRPRPHALGAQPQLLWRPNALSRHLRGQQVANPQSESHLSRPGLRRAEVRAEALSDASGLALAEASGVKVSMPPTTAPKQSPGSSSARSTMRSAIASSRPTSGRCARGCAAPTPIDLFDGYCQRLVIDGMPLWRAHLAMETLHPQWNGYGFTWRRDLNAIEPEQYAHGSFEDEIWVDEPVQSI